MDLIKSLYSQWGQLGTFKQLFRVPDTEQGNLPRGSQCETINTGVPELFPPYSLGTCMHLGYRATPPLETMLVPTSL